MVLKLFPRQQNNISRICIHNEETVTSAIWMIRFPRQKILWFHNGMKHAVFFDIDGTLAIRRTVPESAVKAIRMLRNNGTIVFICTGRNASYVRRHFQAYADGFICANGRYAFLEDRILYDHPIEETLLETARKDVLTCGGGIIFFGNRNAYYTGDNEGFSRFKSAHTDEPIEYLNALNETEPIYTFDVFFHSEEELTLIQNRLQNYCLLNPHLPWPTADVTVFPYDKGTALSAVCQTLEIDKDHSYAFGDGHNDLCMFREAGHNIAMGNAVPELKESAEFVTSSIFEDGVKNGLIHFGLIPPFGL